VAHTKFYLYRSNGSLVRGQELSGHLSENNTGSPPASSPAGNEKVVYAVCYSDFVKFLVISRNYLHLLTVITRNN